MTKEWYDYESDEIEVRWSKVRCIHAAECIRSSPEVFDTAKRPWIQPWNAPADEVVTTIQRCPSGALQFTRKDGGEVGSVPDNNVKATINGPLYVRGELTVLDGAGNTLYENETRLTLCRCGGSGNKPLCDNTHRKIGFQATSHAPMDDPQAEFDDQGSFVIKASTNGPLLLTGNFELLNEAGEVVFQGTKSALCRCGGSSNKPFCDGTHKKIGFVG